MPSSHASKSSASRSGTSALILSILILNTLGIGLLFMKSSLDATRSSDEVGLIVDEIKGQTVGIVTAFARGSQGLPVLPAPIMSATLGYRVVAESEDGRVQLLGKGNCPSVYSVEPSSAPETGGDLYELGYREARVVPEAQDLGRVMIQPYGTYEVSLTSLAELPECSVTARITP